MTALFRIAGPGFWIRFTVQYNLFAGTIVVSPCGEACAWVTASVTGAKSHLFLAFSLSLPLFLSPSQAVGGPEQLLALEEMQQHQQLGCFGLTEKLAGMDVCLGLFLVQCPFRRCIPNHLYQYASTPFGPVSFPALYSQSSSS